MRNYEVTIHHKLLNADGNLSGPGWSRHLVQQYDGTVLAKKLIILRHSLLPESPSAAEHQNGW